MGEFASKGVAGAALGTGIGGLALGVLNGGLGNLLGGWNANGCSENMPVNRYEASKDARIAELETDLKLRDANFYTLGEMGKLRDYVDGRMEKIENQMCKQAIHNEKVAMGLDCISGQVAGINAVLGKITATVIPKDVICPEVMPRFNSWVAPTDTETTAP